LKNGYFCCIFSGDFPSSNFIHSVARLDLILVSGSFSAKRVVELGDAALLQLVSSDDFTVVF
jgi:hypothetical protein